MKLRKLASFYLISLLFHSVLSFEPISLGFGIGSGIGFAGLYAGYEYFKSNFIETCNDKWITPNITGLNYNLHKYLHGQHLVIDVVLKAIRMHFQKKKFNKPLVMSFHGWTGGGKNFVSKIIADSIFVEGSKSKFVHWYISTVHFPHSQKADEYKDSLQQWIKGNVSSCPLSLFIFDEIDKLPIGVMDGIKPFLDHFDHIDGIDFRKCIFIFLSNTGGSEITEKMMDFWSKGKVREAISYFDFEEMIRKGAFNEKGGLFQTSIIDRNLIDYYVPFLPLERKHIKLCIKDHLKERGIGMDEVLVEKVADDMQYFPADTKLFSRTGCKSVEQKVDFALD